MKCACKENNVDKILNLPLPTPTCSLLDSLMATLDKATKKIAKILKFILFEN